MLHFFRPYTCTLVMTLCLCFTAGHCRHPTLYNCALPPIGIEIHHYCSPAWSDWPCMHMHMHRLAHNINSIYSTCYGKLHSHAQEYTIHCSKPWSHAPVTLLYAHSFLRAPSYTFVLYPCCTPVNSCYTFSTLALVLTQCLYYTEGPSMPPALHICALPVVYGKYPPVGSVVGFVLTYTKCW